MRNWTRVIVLAATTMLPAACAESPPTAPDPVTSAILTGVWSGDVSESYGGQGRLRLVIQQVEFALAGTFQLEFDDPDRTRSGTLSGNQATGALPARMQLASAGGFACAPGQATTSYLLVSWTEIQGRLTGTYSGFACVGTITGSFDVKRE